MSVPIIGVGASAGGLKEFEQLFKHLPEKLSAALVIIQHLSSQHDSMLPDILNRYTERPVHCIEDGMEIEAGHIYVIPPKKAVTLEAEQLKLTPLERENGRQLPLDTFFQSLAQERGARAMGVILSGTGEDGSLGAKAIKAADGLVLVQATDTTVYNEMPRNALEAGVVDFALPVSAIPKALLNYIKHGFKLPPTREDEISGENESIRAILKTLEKETGQDFSNYKLNTIKRRIKRRIVARHLSTLEDYEGLLKQDKEELYDLKQELLVSVTSFFRDAEVFEYAYENIIPAIVERSETIRIWIAGCATGEEAYTWAMLFQRYLTRHKINIPIRIFATDIDEEAIDKARKAFYYADALEDMPKGYKEDFFDAQDTGYTIKKYIREKIIFALQNLVQDPPYSRLDLLSCRNLLIYFNKDLQKYANSIFSYALKEKGYLVLGNAETKLQSQNIFEAKHRKFKIYQKMRQDQDHNKSWSLPASSSPDYSMSGQENKKTENKETLESRVRNAILKKHTPPSVLINRDREVLYLQGNMGPYLELTTGEMSNQIIQVARPQLKWALSNSIRMAFNKNKRVEHNNVRLTLREEEEKGEEQQVDIVVMPLEENAEAPPNLWLISFKESRRINRSQTEENIYSNSINLHELEKELAVKEHHLQSTIEKLESTNEELKSANEEAQSANEELQSTNEELETSKEELQSVNEELNITNNELSAKVVELNEVSYTLKNLLTSTDIATLFLDKDLKVFRFTPAISSIVELLDADIGRSIKQFSNKLLYSDWMDDIRAVLEDLQAKEVEVETTEGRYFWMRISPYQTDDKQVEGVVVTFTEITEKKAQEIELEKHRYHLEELVEEQNKALKQREQRFKRIAQIASDYAFGFSMTENKKPELIWSYGDFPAITGYEEPKDPVAFLRSLIPTEKVFSFSRKDEQLSQGKTTTVEHPIQTKNGDIKWIRLESVPEWDGTERKVKEVICTVKDITARKNRSIRIENNERLLKRTERIAHIGSWQMAIQPSRPQNWSDEMYRILGLPIQETPPPLDKALLPVIPKDAEKIRALLEQAENEAASFQLEFDLIRADGDLRHCVLRGYPKQNEQGVVEYIYGSMQDITPRKKIEQELKNSERKFRNIADNVPGLVLKYRLNPDGTDEVLYLSKGVEDLYEVPREKAMQAIMLLWQRIHPEDIDEYRASIEKSAQSLSAWEYEHRILMPDGRVKWIHARGIPFKDEDGSVIWDTLGVEITQQKKAQQQLREREESLKKLNATKDKLFSIIGHDLKGPLSNIIGLSELIQMNEAPADKGENSEDIQQLSRHMHQSAKKLARLLDNLLTWSRSQMDKIYYQPNNFRLRLAADNCIDLIRPQAEKKNIKIYNEIPEQEEAFADEDMVVVVMRNLLSNAVKFTFPKGKIRIYSNRSGASIVIGVADSGMGIPAQLQNSIMASDNQITTVGTNGEKGTGLGLSICIDFVRKNGGRFWVESEEGQGSSFYFTLPRTEKAAEQQEED